MVKGFRPLRNWSLRLLLAAVFLLACSGLAYATFFLHAPGGGAAYQSPPPRGTAPLPPPRRGVTDVLAGVPNLFSGGAGAGASLAEGDGRDGSLLDLADSLYAATEVLNDSIAPLSATGGSTGIGGIGGGAGGGGGWLGGAGWGGGGGSAGGAWGGGIPGGGSASGPWVAPPPGGWTGSDPNDPPAPDGSVLPPAPPPPVPAPEPSSPLLFAAGALVVSHSLRRRRAASHSS